MPLDAYLYPAVVLTTLLTTQSEVDVLTTTFTSGLSIEAGRYYLGFILLYGFLYCKVWLLTYSIIVIIDLLHLHIYLRQC